MQHATFRFYAELNDFLPAERRMTAFSYFFHVGPAVRDAIEGLGVPHTEVDLVLVNGKPEDFSYVLRDGDRVSVYPMFESFDVRGTTRVRPEPLRQTRFILDVHLGRLAAYLRMAGFDSVYRNDYRDADLARIAREEERILLTRDRGLLKRAEVTRGYYVRATSPRAQFAEVLRRFDLFESLRPFARCLRCNSELGPAAVEAVAGRVPSGVLARHHDFLECRSCGRVYWKGTHYDRMRGLIADSARSPQDSGA